MVNSCQEIFRCGRTPLLVFGKPYPEVTAAFLPSSLRNNHSFALVYSTRLPVSVYGTVSFLLCLEAFLGRLLHLISRGEPRDFCCTWSGIKPRFPDLPENHPHTTNANPIMREIYKSSSLHRTKKKSGNINPVSIGSGFRHHLRPD